MSDDLVERLRAKKRCNGFEINEAERALEATYESDPLTDEAADEITRLRSLGGEGEEDIGKGNRDCLTKRRPGEPMFVLLGRDPDAHNIVRSWARRRLAAGGDPEHCNPVLALADRMQAYAADPANAPASAPPADAYPASKQVMDRESVERVIAEYQIGMGLSEEDAWSDAHGIGAAILSLASPAVAENGGADRVKTERDDLLSTLIYVGTALPVLRTMLSAIDLDKGQQQADKMIRLVQEAIDRTDPDLCHALSTPSAPAVEDGFVVVPREPTDAMLAAWATSDKYKDDWRKDCAAGWSSMIAAAPPAKGAGE